MLKASNYHSHTHGAPIGTISLSYEARFLRRRVLETDEGLSFLLDLSQTTSLDQGGAIVLDDGREIVVSAALEPLIAVRATELHRIAWHIGNRHTPCQIETDRLLIQPDHVIEDMLAKLGADLQKVTEPFTPEGGAYGLGRTHSHAH